MSSAVLLLLADARIYASGAAFPWTSEECRGISTELREMPWRATDFHGPSMENARGYGLKTTRPLQRAIMQLLRTAVGLRRMREDPSSLSVEHKPQVLSRQVGSLSCSPIPSLPIDVSTAVHTYLQMNPVPLLKSTTFQTDCDAVNLSTLCLHPGPMFACRICSPPEGLTTFAQTAHTRSTNQRALLCIVLNIPYQGVNTTNWGFPRFGCC